MLARIDVTQTFWTLPNADLGETPPPAETPAWWLWRAWVLLRCLDGVGPTICDKVLHHKRPWLFRSSMTTRARKFDDNTRAKMGGGRAWQDLHDELTRQEPQFTHLEQWFAGEAARRGGVWLTRLRIHDILLWAAITRGGMERESLIRSGQDVLGRPSGRDSQDVPARPRMNKDAEFLAAKLARVHDPHDHGQPQLAAAAENCEGIEASTTAQHRCAFLRLAMRIPTLGVEDVALIRWSP